MNKYLEKLAALLDKEAGIGEIGQGLIKKKLAPAMKNWSKATAASQEALARGSAGSKVAPKVFSKVQQEHHTQRMGQLAKTLVPGMRPSEANRIYSVAARAKRMGVIK